MLGYPEETEEDIEETIHHLKTSNPDLFTITVAYPIKGTSLYAEIEQSKTTSLDWNKSTDRDIDFERAYPRKYYNYATRRVVHEVNYHKKVINKEQFSLAALRMKLGYNAANLGMWWEKRKMKV